MPRLRFAMREALGSCQGCLQEVESTVTQLNPRHGGAMAQSRTTENQRPDPNEKLVRIFDTEQESEAMVVRGLLESAGIDVDMTSLDAQQDILPGVGGTIILVREEDADRARRVIQEYRRTPSDETAEIEITEDPADER